MTLTNEQTNILNLLCTSQPENIELAKTLAEGLGWDINGWLKENSYHLFNIKSADDFMKNVIHLKDKNAASGL